MTYACIYIPETGDGVSTVSMRDRVREAYVMTERPISELYLPAAAVLAAVVVLGYMISRFRRGRAEMTLIDALILAAVVAVLGGVGLPLIESVRLRTQTTTLLQNLQTLRSQIQLYTMEHGGQPPLLFEGALPQLNRATNRRGELGYSSEEYPFGPYLRAGVPVNSITGRSIVTLTDKFPPQEPTGNGG